MDQVADQLLLAKLDNFFPVSDALQADITHILEVMNQSAAWKRNYIRVLWSLVEGYNSTLGQVAREIIRIEPRPLTLKEQKALALERQMATDERIKYTLRAAYKSIGLSPPDMSGPIWSGCKTLIRRREQLSHPKSPSDVRIEDAEWNEIWVSGTWLVKQYFKFVEELAAVADG